MNKISLAGCAFIKDDAILLIRRIKTGWYELPGGKIENGETPEAAARREIKEELCVGIEKMYEIGKKDFNEGNHTMAYIWFQAELASGEHFAIGEPEKFDEFRYISLARLAEYTLSPNMRNFLNEYNLGNILFV